VELSSSRGGRIVWHGARTNRKMEREGKLARAVSEKLTPHEKKNDGEDGRVRRCDSVNHARFERKGERGEGVLACGGRRNLSH